MEETAKQITRRTFLKYVDRDELREWERALGYASQARQGLTMARDFHVSYYRSQFQGRRCVGFDWSAIDHIFTEASTMTRITYQQIREAMKGEPYPMSLVGEDIAVVVAAVNQGIDAHLEACNIVGADTYRQHYPMDIQPSANFPRGASLGKRMECRVSPESLPVLLRRLTEGEDESAWHLAGDILGTLGIDVETCCYEIVSPVDEAATR